MGMRVVGDRLSKEKNPTHPPPRTGVIGDREEWGNPQPTQRKAVIRASPDPQAPRPFGPIEGAGWLPGVGGGVSALFKFLEVFATTAASGHVRTPRSPSPQKKTRKAPYAHEAARPAGARHRSGGQGHGLVIHNG